MTRTPPPPLPVDTLVERFHALAVAPLPPDVAALTRTYLVDSIGVGLAGTITPENRSLLATAAPWEGPHPLGPQRHRRTAHGRDGQRPCDPRARVRLRPPRSARGRPRHRIRPGKRVDAAASGGVAAPRRPCRPRIHNDDYRAIRALMCAVLSGLLMRDGDLTVDALTPTNLADASLLAFSAERVTVRLSDPAMDPNAFLPQRIVLTTTTTGRRYEVTVTDTLGSPTRPLTPEQHLGKVTSNAEACARHSGVAVDMAKVAEIVERIEQLVDTNELWKTLGSTITAGASA